MKLFDKYVVAIMTVLGSLMILYHMIYTQSVLLEPTQHQNLHIMFALSLVYLMSFSKAKSIPQKLLSLCLLGLSIYSTSYIFIEYSELQEIRGPIGMLTDQDVIVGTLLVLLCIEASRRAFGLDLPTVRRLDSLQQSCCPETDGHVSRLGSCSVLRI